MSLIAGARLGTYEIVSALGACTALHPVYRRLLNMTLEELRVLDDHIEQLDQEMARLLGRYRMPSSG